MQLYNTLSRKKDELPAPENHKTITMYACGPTVYDETHIGHMRKYTMDDILKRTLQFLGYDVKQVMNITDVGHLTGDDDSGEDKLEKGAKKRGKTVWDVAQEYEAKFWETMAALNIHKEEITVLNATQNIDEMIKLNKILDEKGYTYETDEALYFDVTKFHTYGKLSGQKLEDKKQAARDDVYVDPGKKHPADFALWFKRVGRFADHTMHWESPWGDGFPGWHIECSAMSMKGLQTETIDIHTGGTDHIPVHHENEIAQSEAATGKPFVKYWVHHAFLHVAGEKMSKSKNNFYTLKDVREHGIDPLALRLLFMSAHYRTPMNFTWEAAEGANTSYKELQKRYQLLHEQTNGSVNSNNDLSGSGRYFLDTFVKNVSNDLNLPMAVANMWYMLRNDECPAQDKRYLLEQFDRVLGLGFSKYVKQEIEIPENILTLAQQRQQARDVKQFDKADNLRKQIEENGYLLEDTQESYIIKKK